MNNEQMKPVNVKILEEISNTLMRDLTQEELDIILNKGYDYFITEKLAMSMEEYKALEKIKNIISAYCTKSQADFEKELEGEIDIPYYALKSIVNSLEDKIKDKASKEQVDSCGVEATTEMVDSETKCSKEEADALELCNLLNKIPDSVHNWLECYVKYVKDHKSVIDVLKSGKCPETEDERIGDIVDAIKDATIDACIEKLKVDGEIELDPEIMSEVTSKIWHSEYNVRINITNNKLKVEFK